MEEKEIKRILDKRILAYFPGQSPEDDAAADEVLEAAAAEIARLVGQDKARLKVCENGLRYCGERYDVLLAQVAEMREALELSQADSRTAWGLVKRSGQILGPPHYQIQARAEDARQKALAAAQEVKSERRV